MIGTLGLEAEGSSAAMAVKSTQDAANAAVLARSQTLALGMLARAIEDLQRHDAAHEG